MAKSKSLELVGQKFGMLEVVSLGDVVITPNGKDTEKTERTWVSVVTTYHSGILPTITKQLKHVKKQKRNTLQNLHFNERRIKWQRFKH